MTAGPTPWQPPRDGVRAVRDGLADYVAAVARRTRPVHFVLGALVISALAMLATTGLATPAIMNAPMTAKIARASEYLVLGFVIVIGIIVADEAVERGRRRGATYTIAVIVSAALGAVLGWEVRLLLGLHFLPPGMGHAFNSMQPLLHQLDLALIGILVGGLTTFVHVNRRTALAARRRQHESEQARARARRRTLESELQALQARVEPMFLFDTLARIRGLYRVDPAAAGATMEDLIAYLRAALPHLRESASTVRQEMELARAWLDIVGRSTASLQVEIELDPAVEEARLPAMVVLPLVQRALAAAGGPPVRLRIEAAARDRRLELAISAAAASCSTPDGGAVEALGRRLKALPGAAATLRVEADAQGNLAVVELPLETSPSGDTS